ncbi:hypothetical protein [Mammaliicoccus sciuri]|uniref:hypothetical protein n=1 Tax=Mammaliicoccus sciuri TaxID=1296 RepID=UPI003AEA858F
MEQHVKTKSRLLNYLNEFKISEIDYSKENIFNQLMIIEAYIQDVAESQNYHYIKLKESKKINVNKLSRMTNISRSSIYNSPNILLHYINRRIEMIDSYDLTMLDSVNDLTDRISFLEGINNELKQQVVDSYEAKLYISELENEIKMHFDRRKRDIIEIDSLRDEVKLLQSKLNHYNKDKVIRFSNDDGM